ncbi:uncharacterized protein BO80DRAFT_129599 [Aspergillus ibericus CBS 121593]|uniref:Uncharacterized protein n=1 Tax=Aspergillus ibericus CBS 121593 TaxID=1448316 RepID=A0A395HC04_9EURO|nr:hypothetical protein BO80DRAFT_129599 [Aspergillus ibericus CBS 121593]RAL05166.1 hypothetical protein BO80DRAFT_129599 [Aspergillus ibericus CBS 121593]
MLSLSLSKSFFFRGFAWPATVAVPLAVVCLVLVVTRHYDCTTEDRYHPIRNTVPVFCNCPLPEVCPSLSPRRALFPPATQNFPLLGFACFDFAACRRGPRSTCCGPGDQLHLPGRQPQRTNHGGCFSWPRLLLTIAGHSECRVAVPSRFFGLLCFYLSSLFVAGSSTERPLTQPDPWARFQTIASQYLSK